MNRKDTISSMDQTATHNPLVSVIISAYRVTEYIPEALDSVFAQAFTDLEVVVVNDGCPDTEALEAALEPYRSRIVYLKQANGGVSSARNAGIRVARAQWLAFLDADDVWLPGYLDRQLAMLADDPSIDMVFPNGVIFGKTRMAGKFTMDYSPSDGEITFERVLAGECTVSYCALLRRDLVIKVGMFNTALRGSEDFNLWLRILKAGGRIVSHRTPLFCYRRRDNSLTADSLWMNARILESLRLAETTIALSPTEQQALESHRRRVQFEIAMSMGKAAFEKRAWASAVIHYTEAYELVPSRKVRLILLLLKVCPGLLYSFFSWREKRSGIRFALQHV